MKAEYSLPPNVIFERENGSRDEGPGTGDQDETPNRPLAHLEIEVIRFDARRGSGSDRGRKRSRKQQHQKHQECRKKKRHQQQQHHHTTTSKSKSLALFLDYLRQCPAIEIVAACDDSTDHAYNGPTPPPAPTAPCPGAVTFRRHTLPLLRKYAANYGSDCHFEHKTKIYALYRHLEIGGPLEQVQQQQQLKVGHIQLRFKMLFAEPPPKGHAHGHALGHPPPGDPETPPPSPPQVMPLPLPLPLPAALLQDQQTAELMSGNTSNIELMEAMKKLDADLVALFATAAAEPLKKKQQQVLWTEPESEQIPDDLEEEEELVITPEIFRRCNGLQLHLEALTLQPEGTQRMELVQNEVRPIFTVECQLSADLIRKVPRAPMFHIMQFESEKFHSLTQCTRFGQTAQRQVDMEEKDWEDLTATTGHVDFTVWWREPGTCLNEMLGMGRLELRELYEASLLEQCKCIAIKRRDIHLGSVYVKISLLQNGLEQQGSDQQHLGDGKNESGNKAAGEYI